MQLSTLIELAFFLSCTVLRFVDAESDFRSAVDNGVNKVVLASFNSDSNVSTNPLDPAATTKYLRFAGYKPVLFEPGVELNTNLFRVGLLAVQPNPPKFVADIVAGFVAWYEGKHGKTEGDERTDGDKLMDFAIEGLFDATTADNKEYSAIFAAASAKYLENKQ